jgi:hypothetical protein
MKRFISFITILFFTVLVYASPPPEEVINPTTAIVQVHPDAFVISTIAVAPVVMDAGAEMIYADQLPDSKLLASLSSSPAFEDGTGTVEKEPAKSLISKIWNYCEKNWGILASILFLLSELLASSKLKANSLFQLFQDWLRKKATHLKPV